MHLIFSCPVAGKFKVISLAWRPFLVYEAPLFVSEEEVFWSAFGSPSEFFSTFIALSLSKDVVIVGYVSVSNGYKSIELVSKVWKKDCKFLL